MTAKNIAEIIMESVYFHDNLSLKTQLKKYILGKTSISPAETMLAANIVFHKLCTDDNIKYFNKDDNFFNNEDGKVLIKFTELFYKTFPSQLQDIFMDLPGKYNLYKFLKFNEDFVKEDFQKNSSNIINQQCWLKYIKLADEYIRNYPHLAKENIKNYNESLELTTTVTRIIFISLLLKNNCLTNEEKEYWLNKTDEYIINFAKETATDPNMYNYVFPYREMKNFEFLKDENILFTSVSISEAESFYIQKEKITAIITGAIAMLEYSIVAKNFIKLVIQAKGYRTNLTIQFIANYKEISPVKNANIYIRLYEIMKFPLLYICKSYLKYENKNEKEEIENFIKLMKKYEKEAYNLLTGEVFDIYELKQYISLLYAEDRGFNYIELPKLFEKKIKSISNLVESILKSKEREVRSVIEEIKNSRNKIISDTAFRLIRMWDNNKIGKKMKDMTDINEITVYISDLYTKNNDKNLPFPKQINYGTVRLKDSEEYVSDIITKYFVSEYMLLKDIYIIKGCQKILEIVNIFDLRNLIKNIFDMWIAEDSNLKYKNIAVLMAIAAGDSEIALIKKQIDFWSENGKTSLAVFAVQALNMTKDKAAFITVNNISKSHKNVQVKKAALEVIDTMPEPMEDPLEEIEEITIPNLGFGEKKYKIFDYGGDRFFKIILNDNFQLTICSYEGKIIESMPRLSTKYGENKEAAAEAKEDFINIENQLKLIVKSQKAKLAKAITIESRWEQRNWKKIFIENPIMNIFATQLVWLETNENGDILKTFRCAKDGTFRTVDDKKFELKSNTDIALLHPIDIDREELEAWIKLFKDYGIVQPVDQLNIPI